MKSDFFTGFQGKRFTLAPIDAFQTFLNSGTICGGHIRRQGRQSGTAVALESRSQILHHHGHLGGG